MQKCTRVNFLAVRTAKFIICKHKVPRFWYKFPRFLIQTSSFLLTTALHRHSDQIQAYCVISIILSIKPPSLVQQSSFFEYVSHQAAHKCPSWCSRQAPITLVLPDSRLRLTPDSPASSTTTPTQWCFSAHLVATKSFFNLHFLLQNLHLYIQTHIKKCWSFPSDDATSISW